MARKTGRRMAATLIGMMALMPASICAEARQDADADIVVTGARSKLSSWREAETSHVLMLSDGSEAELTRLSRNLEWLHFLLSSLMGRGGGDDDPRQDPHHADR